MYKRIVLFPSKFSEVNSDEQEI